MVNNRRGGSFFDDDGFDDEAETNLGGGQPYYPPPQNPGYNQPPPFDDSEAATVLPNRGQPNPGGNFDPGQMDKTQMPNSGYPGSPHYDPVEETLLGEDDEEVQPLGFLIVKRPLIRRGYVYKLPPVCTIGRTQGQVRLETDRRVSGLHARIRMTEDPDTGEPVFVLIDMDSKTGTRINEGERIDGRTRLNEGDEINIGDHVFVFKMLKD